MVSTHLELPVGVKPNKTIPQYFSGKNVFITGATGLMGKMLVEKLLRSCPDVGTIYVLIRSKRGKNVRDRWNETVDSELFSVLNEIHKNALQKVKVVEGDVMLADLGLSPEDRQELINNVSIIYHSAATVRFNEPLQRATMINVKGTKEVCKLALEIKKLEIFMHVSTAFSQCYPTLEEKLYPARGNPQELIELSETMDSTLLKIVTSKICEGFPNTYTFTKCLGETLVKDMCEGKIPTIIFRPSIVMPPINEPIMGWIENLNGPIGVIYAGTKGVIRAIKSNKDYELEYCPVDTTIQGMIKATWFESFNKDLNVAVYNGSKSNLIQFTINNQVQSSDVLINNKIWCKPILDCNCHVTENNLIFWFIIYAYQFVPAILADIVMRVMGKKPIILNLLSKLVSVLVTFSFFSLTNWKFNNQKFVELDDYLMDDDKEAFANQLGSVDVDDQRLAAFVNMCKKMNDGDVKQNFIKYQRLKYVYMLKNVLVYTFFGTLLYNYILQPFYVNFIDYLINV